MRVLIVNCGSSTLKFQLTDTAKEDAAPASECDLARGVIERIGSQATLDFQAGSNAYRDTATSADHQEATRQMFAWLDTASFLALWLFRCYRLSRCPRWTPLCGTLTRGRRHRGSHPTP
jgi:acetate kinase